VHSGEVGVVHQVQRCRDGLVEVQRGKGIQSSCSCSSAVVHRSRAGTEVVQRWSKDGAEEEMVHLVVQGCRQGVKGTQSRCRGAQVQW
jgi:hypothetical protein